VIVIGGGPAGLSAAIYAARANRSVLIIDRGEGRSTSHEVNENYLGFPRGIAARELRRKGMMQAKRFGAEAAAGTVTRIKRERGLFVVRAGRRLHRGRTLILATGVVDHFPHIPNADRYVGRSLFWCIVCDGWKARGKRVVLVGNDDEAATTALQFLNFTDRITMVTNQRRCAVSARKLRAMERAGIDLRQGLIVAAGGRGRMLRWLEMDDGKRVALDLVFSMQGSRPASDLARGMRVKRKDGYVVVDKEQRTSVRGVYAAGDVTKQHAHQVVTAAHEGATAGQTANYDLYRPEQRA
jgi:thioredoxin reductase (NADPH)